MLEVNKARAASKLCAGCRAAANNLEDPSLILVSSSIFCSKLYSYNKSIFPKNTFFFIKIISIVIISYKKDMDQIKNIFNLISDKYNYYMTLNYSIHFSNSIQIIFEKINNLHKINDKISYIKDLY